ncbi:MAG: prephenate dehydrogenase/arogenate dehydrogenase family protein [Fibrobacterota bacterium]
MRRKFPKAMISGVSRKDSLDKAEEMSLIDEACEYEDIEKILPGKDLIVLCTPISRIIKLISELGNLKNLIDPNAIITDIGSTKKTIMEKASEFFTDGPVFIGGHPMTGSERSGLQASDPFLYQNAVYVLTPCDKCPEDKVQKLGAFCTSLGSILLVMDPVSHDKRTAGISHLPQAAAVCLMNTVAGRKDRFGEYTKLAAGGFRDLTRIASSPYSMWKDILLTNSEEISFFIDQYVSELENLKKEIGKPGAQSLFDKARVSREEISHNRKGFLKPLSEVMVVCEDKPGIIFSISKILSDINIKDIEVVKVREGEGGTIRLGFETAEEAAEVVKRLNKNHFTARTRD